MVKKDLEFFVFFKHLTTKHINKKKWSCDRREPPNILYYVN